MAGDWTMANGSAASTTDATESGPAAKLRGSLAAGLLRVVMTSYEDLVANTRGRGDLLLFADGAGEDVGDGVPVGVGVPVAAGVGASAAAAGVGVGSGLADGGAGAGPGEG